MLPIKSPKKQTLTPQQQADAARIRGVVDRMYGQQTTRPPGVSNPTGGPKPAPGFVNPRQVTPGVSNPTGGPKPTPRPTPVVQQPVRPSRPIVQQTVSGGPAPRPSGPMVPVRGGGMYPASMAATMKKGGAVKKSASAKTSSKTMASRRGDGCAIRGKTKAGIK